MPALIFMLVTFFAGAFAYAECVTLPKEYAAQKIDGKTVFVNADKTIAAQIQCDQAVTEAAANESLKLGKMEFYGKEDGISRVYTKWSRKYGLIRLTVVAKSRRPASINEIEKLANATLN